MNRPLKTALARLGRYDGPEQRRGWRAGSNRGLSHGFTLIEMMVSLLILAVLLALGVPGMQWLAARDRVTNATNELVTAIQLARSEAVRLSINVTLCASSNQATCNEDGDWTDGWILFRSDNQTLIRVGAPMHVTLGVDATAGSIQFNSTGATGGAPIHLQINASGSEPRCIRLLASGFVATEKMECP